MAYSLKLKLPLCSLNLGICRLDEQAMTYVLSVRSPLESMKEETVDRLKTISSLFGGEVVTDGDYPGWAYSEESPLRGRDRFPVQGGGKGVFCRRSPRGLECGIWKSATRSGHYYIRAVLWDNHTPNERLDLASFRRSFEYLKKLWPGSERLYGGTDCPPAEHITERCI
jgi:dipeptidase D